VVESGGRGFYDACESPRAKEFIMAVR
jgi:hypothetical protein